LEKPSLKNKHIKKEKMKILNYTEVLTGNTQTTLDQQQSCRLKRQLQPVSQQPTAECTISSWSGFPHPSSD